MELLIKINTRIIYIIDENKLVGCGVLKESLMDKETLLDTFRGLIEPPPNHYKNFCDFIKPHLSKLALCPYPTECSSDRESPSTFIHTHDGDTFSVFTEEFQITYDPLAEDISHTWGVYYGSQTLYGETLESVLEALSI